MFKKFYKEVATGLFKDPYIINNDSYPYASITLYNDTKGGYNIDVSDTSTSFIKQFDGDLTAAQDIYDELANIHIMITRYDLQMMGFKDEEQYELSDITVKKGQCWAIKDGSTTLEITSETSKDGYWAIKETGGDKSHHTVYERSLLAFWEIEDE